MTGQPHPCAFFTSLAIPFPPFWSLANLSAKKFDWIVQVLGELLGLAFSRRGLRKTGVYSDTKNCDLSLGEIQDLPYLLFNRARVP